MVLAPIFDKGELCRSICLPGKGGRCSLQYGGTQCHREEECATMRCWHSARANRRRGRVGLPFCYFFSGFPFGSMSCSFCCVVVGIVLLLSLDMPQRDHHHNCHRHDASVVSPIDRVGAEGRVAGGRAAAAWGDYGIVADLMVRGGMDWIAAVATSATSLLPSTPLSFSSSQSLLPHSSISLRHFITFARGVGCLGSYPSYYCDHGSQSWSIASCSCSCYSGFYGLGCSTRDCTLRIDCVEAQTASVRGTSTISTSDASCTCNCKNGFTGRRCADTLCNVTANCVAANTVSVSGTVPACSCSCREQFVGATCQTRICHVNHDCQGRGRSISGTYPNCNCACLKSFGGRKCRTLSVTRTLSIAPPRTRTATLTLNPSPTMTVISDSLTVVLTSTSSVSGTRGSTSSATLLPTRTLSESISVEISPSTTLASSMSVSTSTSLSMSLTPSPSISQSPTLSSSPSGTFSSSASLSQTPTATCTRSESPTLSGTWSVSISGSASLSQSESPSPSASHTVSTTISASESVTMTCKPLDDLPASTCSVLRPLVGASIISWESLSPYLLAPNATAGGLSSASQVLARTTLSGVALGGVAVSADWILKGRANLSSAPAAAAAADSSSSPHDTFQLEGALRDLAGHPHDCTAVTVPYSEWRGRSGALHSIRVFSIDTRIPLKGMPPLPKCVDRLQVAIDRATDLFLDEPFVAGGGLHSTTPSADFAAVSARMDDERLSLVFDSARLLRNATLMGYVVSQVDYSECAAAEAAAASVLGLGDGVAALPPDTLPLTRPQMCDFVQSTIEYSSVTAAIRYTGPPTMNRRSYFLHVREWVRCPIPFTGTMTVTLEAAGRLFPIAAQEAINGVGAWVSVAGSFTVSPSVLLVGSVTARLRRTTRCTPLNLDDPDEDDAWEEYRGGGLLNPFGLAIGGGGEARGLVRGALLMSVVYGAVLGLLSVVFACVADCIQREIRRASGDTDAGDQEYRRRRWEWLEPYPSALIAVFAFMLDGMVGAGVLLGLAGSDMADQAIGWAFVAVCYVGIGCITFALTARFPAGLVAMRTLPAAAVEEQEEEAHATNPAALGVGGVLVVPRGVDDLALDGVGEDRAAVPPDVAVMIEGIASLSSMATDDAAALDHRTAALPQPSKQIAEADLVLDGSFTAPPSPFVPNSNPLLSPLMHVLTNLWLRVRPVVDRLVTPTHEWVAAVGESEELAAGSTNSKNATPAGHFDDEELQQYVHGGPSSLGAAAAEEEEEGSRPLAAEDGGVHPVKGTPPSKALTPPSQAATAAERWFVRHGALVGDAHCHWFTGYDFATTATVCAVGCASLVASSANDYGFGIEPWALTTFCAVRGSVMTALLTGRLFVALWWRPEILPYQWLILSAVALLQVLSAALGLANAFQQDVVLELCMDAMGAVVTLLTGAMTVVDYSLLFREARSTIRFVVSLVIRWLRCQWDWLWYQWALLVARARGGPRPPPPSPPPRPQVALRAASVAVGSHGVIPRRRRLSVPAVALDAVLPLVEQGTVSVCEYEEVSGIAVDGDDDELVVITTTAGVEGEEEAEEPPPPSCEGAPATAIVPRMDEASVIAEILADFIYFEQREGLNR